MTFRNESEVAASSQLAEAATADGEGRRWSRYRFKGQLVFAQVDESGGLVKDERGRVAMRYRANDPKLYHANAVNLEAAGPDEGGTGTTSRPASKPSASAVAATPPSRRVAEAVARVAVARPAVAGAAAAQVIHMYTDGACTGNPGPMGIGVVLLERGGRKEWSEYLGQGTNNIAELTAIERAVEEAPRDGRPLHIYTDSAYAIGLLSKGWKAKANVELVARIRATLLRWSQESGASVRFVKVAGHSGVPENERCDELARSAVTRRASRRIG